MEFGRFLAAALPATGENVSIWPFVLLGVGILLIGCPGGSADRQQEEGRIEERSLRAGSAVPSEPGTEVRKSPAEGSSFRGAFGMRYPKTALQGDGVDRTLRLRFRRRIHHLPAQRAILSGSKGERKPHPVSYPSEGSRAGVAGPPRKGRQRNTAGAPPGSAFINRSASAHFSASVRCANRAKTADPLPVIKQPKGWKRFISLLSISVSGRRRACSNTLHSSRPTWRREPEHTASTSTEVRGR